MAKGNLILSRRNSTTGCSFMSYPRQLLLLLLLLLFLLLLLSCNAIFSYLTNNNLLDHQIQKGFTSKLSGTLQHTAQMANIIKKAKTKQRSLIITLLDFKNAFGEVQHNLIQEVLRYHHIPNHMQSLVRSLYTDFQTSFISSEFQTPFINVGRGVLQGDCLSPLLFNLCFNTFIQHIKDENYRKLGYAASINDGLSFNPVHWFQFADDAAVISGQESENQILHHLVSMGWHDHQG